MARARSKRSEPSRKAPAQASAITDGATHRDAADPEPLLLIISSPSGAGKTTLTRALLARFSDLRFSVSHTTRTSRRGEIDGRDYHFIDQPTFRRMVEAGAFAEWAEVHGNLYGTALSEIDRCREEGKQGIVFDIDYQGARQIKRARPAAVGVFILPPSMAELERRLRGRASDDAAAIERRFRNATREIEHHALFDYVIVNHDVDAATERLCAIVLAERARHARMAPIAEALLAQARARA
jgi:guanylate kinase